MTDHLHALAMRTKAVSARWEDHVSDNSPKYLSDWQRGLVAGQQALRATILALPLEADHAELLAEARQLPEVATLIKKARRVWNSWDGDLDPDDMTELLAAILALEPPE